MKSEKPPPLLIAWLDSKLGRRSGNIFDPGLCQILSNTGSGRQLVRTNPEPPTSQEFHYSRRNGSSDWQPNEN